MTTIRYFIPEDGDIESQPNVFLSPKSRSAGAPPTLGQIMNAFPVPGQYHFRFKTALVPGTDRDKGSMAVWMDVTDERQPVPTWQGGIVVKVTRITMEDDDDDDDDDDHHFGNKTQQPAASHAHHHQQQQQQRQQPPARAPPSHSHSSSMGSANSGDHIDLFNSPQPTANAVPPAPSSGGSLLDFDTGGHHTTPAPQSNNAHADFLGMTAPTPSAAGAPPSSSLPPMGGGGGYPPANNMYAQQQQQQQQQQYQQQQNSGGAFGGLGTPWK